MGGHREARSQRQAPQLLYGEPDLTVRIVRDLFTEDFSELIIDGNGGPTDAYDAVDGYVTHVAPHLEDRIRRWETEDGRDVFAAYRLDEQIAKALERKVFLPSGGSLVIDRTEAMTVIDVNTGKFTGSGGNLEATVTSNNLEAAEEIVRQLRLRDIGGIIVIDFIDMVLPNNRELLLRRLVECLGRDRTRHQVAEVTSLGLVQMTRKKIGTGLLEAFTTECPHCHGRGVELHDMPVESQKQADGGTREPRPRDQRRGGGSGGGGSNGGGSTRRRVERPEADSADQEPRPGAHEWRQCPGRRCRDGRGPAQPQSSAAAAAVAELPPVSRVLRATRRAPNEPDGSAHEAPSEPAVRASRRAVARARARQLRSLVQTRASQSRHCRPTHLVREASPGILDQRCRRCPLTPTSPTTAAVSDPADRRRSSAPAPRASMPPRR